MIELLEHLADNATNYGKNIALFGAVFFLIEKIKPAEPGVPFFKKDFLKEFELATLNSVLLIPAFAAIITFTLETAGPELIPYHIFEDLILGLPLLWQFLIALFIMDFSTYWRHRFTHAFMWSYHSVHHSAEHLTWITGLRLHPAEVLIAMTLDMTALHILGFDGNAIFFAAVFMQGYNYFAHANLNIKFERPLRYLLVSPHYHRWHHANEKAAYDKNFCSVFPVLDIIFGTYHHPDDRLPAQYGLSAAQTAEYPSPLVGQLLYPFKKNICFLKKALRIDIDRDANR